MNKTRFLMIGGFLGAGKTTAIARLARHYTARGLRVGLVTNDQAYGLVDTHALRAQGFDVGEVPGACFCCKFDDLVDTAAALGVEQRPDVILAEPVGSCTDLMATVLRPLGDLWGDRYELGPLAVLCKPEHGRKILGGGTGGFSPQAAYIFLKQLEEAQLLVLNKVDRLADSERAELLQLLSDRFPDKRVLTASGISGEGFEELIAGLAAGAGPAGEPLEIDYDTYADGEAALGWFNAAVHFARADDCSRTDWSLDGLAKQLTTGLSQALLKAGLEPGHVKVLASSGRSTAVANWVASDAPVELSVATGIDVSAADVLLNVRVHGQPVELDEFVRRTITEVAQRNALTCQLSSVQYFSPGRPEPVHRYR